MKLNLPNLPLGILRQIKPLYILTPCFSKINFNPWKTNTGLHYEARTAETISSTLKVGRCYKSEKITHLHRSFNDAQFCVSCLQRILWATAKTTVS
jgi:hypothetical protein